MNIKYLYSIERCTLKSNKFELPILATYRANALKNGANSPLYRTTSYNYRDMKTTDMALFEIDAGVIDIDALRMQYLSSYFTRGSSGARNAVNEDSTNVIISDYHSDNDNDNGDMMPHTTDYDFNAITIEQYQDVLQGGDIEVAVTTQDVESGAGPIKQRKPRKNKATHSQAIENY